MLKFTDFFKDKNDINEKTVIGSISFMIMFMFALGDLVTGFFGKDLFIHQYIYDSFLYLTLGVFGISSADKYINKKHGNSDMSESRNERNGGDYRNEQSNDDEQPLIN